MKIIKLTSENFKGLKAVEIEPDENFQVISGKNAQGKTSVLDSIWAAISGKAALKATDKPIREGEKEAVVKVELDDIVVTRKWKGDKSTLEVTAKDGARYSSPQTMLDGLVGRLSFDPLSFANLDPKKQKEALQELVSIDFTALDLDRKGFYEERTYINQDCKKLEGALSELPYTTKDTPDEELSVSAVLPEINAAQEQRHANADKRAAYEQLRHDGTRAIEEIKSIEAEIGRLKLQLDVKKDAYNDICDKGKASKAALDQLIEPDTTLLEEKLQNVESINHKVRQKKERTRIENEIEECKKSSEYLTQKIVDIDQLKKDTLQAAEFPIEGLNFDEEGITFKGIPFKQCSTAERLKVSMAMAMALNPELRVIRILDGSLLDSDNLALIKEMAQEKDYQVWVEVVDDSGKVGIQIEDGQVKGA
ncbi:putative ATP-binding protein involved in virulence [Paenibacillus anaericanus]|uniref:AAA family ATPase n=1 Tax=Paenibacillus anaericanus TaxID=170367 RepID=UPI002788DB21|nr:AAA family ATPase [Paenibacillus anaericanus]MDQ0091625.1 putative ATP-binding protein involved in virulence [Paenibacillus anaericanus]